MVGFYPKEHGTLATLTPETWPPISTVNLCVCFSTVGE